MKLYATTTSERASKGQGGNKFLKIELSAGDKNNPVNMGLIEMTTKQYKNNPRRFYLKYFTPNGKIKMLANKKTINTKES